MQTLIYILIASAFTVIFGGISLVFSKRFKRLVNVAGFNFVLGVVAVMVLFWAMRWL
jgi:small basic protein